MITVDYEKYAHFLDDSELTEQQKQEFLQTLWNIIVEFVSLGFDVHPLQQAKNACGKPEEIASKPAATKANAVKCSHKILTDRFVSAADLETDPATDGVE